MFKQEEVQGEDRIKLYWPNSKGPNDYIYLDFSIEPEDIVQQIELVWTRAFTAGFKAGLEDVADRERWKDARFNGG